MKIVQSKRIQILVASHGHRANSASRKALLACVLVGLLAGSAFQAQAVDVSFDNRQNVDLLNSDAVTITSAAPGSCQPVR